MPLPNTKIKTREELTRLTKEFKSAGKTVGFTSGAFDIIHAGHIDYLYKAKGKCDVLIVGLNSDESIKKYKNPNRPINTFEHRLKVLSALEMLDYIFRFDEVNNNSNITLIQPNIYFKASNYTKSDLSSAPIIEKLGGTVKLIPVVEGTSTSKIIQRIHETEKSKNQISFQNSICESINLPKLKEKIKVIFLDRDGTINKDIFYLHEPEKFVFENNALEGLKKKCRN